MHPFEQRSVAGLLEERALLSPDHPFLTWAPFAGRGEVWTYGRFEDAVARVAGGLIEKGIVPGDHVVLYLDNCPEFLIAFFAAAWIGAVCVPVNAGWTGAELAYAVELTQSKGIVTQPRLFDAAAAAARSGQWIVTTETDAGSASDHVCEMTDAFASLVSAPVPRQATETTAAACVLFTSGTTARPKGVVWTHANVLWGAKMGAMQQGLGSDDVHLVFLPLFHVVALTWSILPTIWTGGSAVLQPRFSASRFWHCAIENRCTWAAMVPFCTAVLARQPVPAGHFFRCWGHAVYRPDYERLFGLRLLGWWGMTEIITQGIVGDLSLNQAPLSVGRPSVAYDLKVVDDGGQPVRPNQPGELCIRGVRGISIFLEYLRDQQATEAAFDREGYFRTGDRVLINAQGAIAFVDRIKDVIKVGGENVSAPEVEGVIAAVDGVVEVAVVAKPDSIFGEVPVAFISVNVSAVAAGAIVDAVLLACREHLARFKLPRDVIVIEEFPRVSIGKVAKAALRQRFG